MSKIVVFSAVCAVCVAVTGAVAWGASSDNGRLQRQLAEVRRATAQFHDVEVAEAAGYLNPGTEACVADPALGGMGFHFVNPSLIFDGGVLDPTKPEVLLYAPKPNGERQLAGVEYLVRTADWSGTTAPDLFGKPFDGPMTEHEENTTGDHYDQHAWVWAPNPDGVLAAWNPRIDCP